MHNRSKCLNAEDAYDRVILYTKLAARDLQKWLTKGGSYINRDKLSESECCCSADDINIKTPWMQMKRIVRSKPA